MVYVACYLETLPSGWIRHSTESSNDHVAYNSFRNRTPVEPNTMYRNAGDELEPRYVPIDLSKIIKIVKDTK